MNNNLRTKSESIFKNPFFLCLLLFNFLLHGVGTYLLVRLHLLHRESTQKFYILNLAISEFLLSIESVALYTVLNLDQYLKSDSFIATLHVVRLAYAGVRYSYMAAMFYLTGDQLAHALFPFRYRQIWSLGYSKILVVTTWVFITVITIICIHQKWYHQFTCFFAIPSCLNIIYLIFAVITYIAIFDLYVKSKRKSKLDSGLHHNNDSLFQLFVHSRFYVSVVIIACFLILTVLPEMIHSIHLFVYPFKVDYVVFFRYYAASITLSYTIDGIVYIYLQKPVRKLFWRTLQCRGNRVANETGIQELRGTVVSTSAQTRNFCE